MKNGKSLQTEASEQRKGPGFCQPHQSPAEAAQWEVPCRPGLERLAPLQKGLEGRQGARECQVLLRLYQSIGKKVEL